MTQRGLYTLAVCKFLMPEAEAFQNGVEASACSRKLKLKKYTKTDAYFKLICICFYVNFKNMQNYPENQEIIVQIAY